MKRKDISRSALIVIDMQRYFLDPAADAYLAPPRTLVPNALVLIEAFRGAGLTIAFTQHAHPKGDPAGQMGRWWDGRLPRLGDPQVDLVDEIRPRRGEITLTKTRYSAFENTDLDSRLRRRGVTAVVLCGVMTNLCVETTARHAFMKDFQPVIVEDACATSSAAFHKASLRNLEYGFAYIIKTRDVIAALERKR